MAVTKMKAIKRTLRKAFDCIEKTDKTDGKMFVSSFCCSYETADIGFEYALSQALQKGNNLAFYLIQSLESGKWIIRKHVKSGGSLPTREQRGSMRTL